MIEKWVVTTLADLCCIEEHTVQMESRLLEDLDMDSLDTIDLIAQAEDEYDIVISTDVLSTVKTVQDAVNYLRMRLS